MRICLASLFGIGRRSRGPQTHCYWLKKYFAETGVPCVYVSPFNYHRCLVYPVFAVRYLFKRRLTALSSIWFREWHYFFLKKALSEILAREKFDIVNAQDPLSALAALELREKICAEYQVVLTVHMARSSEAEEEAYGNNIKKGGWYYKKVKQLEQFVFLRVDKIAFVSRYIKEIMLEEFPLLRNKAWRVIYNGVGDGLNDEHKRLMPEESRPSPVVLVNIGSLEKIKNQEFLLRVLSKLVVKFPSLQLYLLGEGEERRRLERMAFSFGLQRNIKFAGFVPDTQGYLKRSYLYLHSSLTESCPFTLLEALSCGLPVVSFAVGGIPEIITHGSTGFLVEDQSETAFSGYIEELLGDNVKYARMQSNCLKTFHEKFTYQTMGNNFTSLYKMATRKIEQDYLI